MPTPAPIPSVTDPSNDDKNDDEEVLHLPSFRPPDSTHFVVDDAETVVCFPP